MDVDATSNGEQSEREVLGPVSGGIRLDQVELNHCGQVCEVRAGETEIERLKSMGVCVGRRLMLVRAGDPMIVKVLGSRIGISARLARRVMVLPCAGDAFGEAR